MLLDFLRILKTVQIDFLFYHFVSPIDLNQVFNSTVALGLFLLRQVKAKDLI